MGIKCPKAKARPILSCSKSIWIHQGIVSEELWEKARDKRVATGIKLASKIGKDRTYLLTGILKCPKCGSPMNANRIRWTKKDGTEKEVMY